MKFVADKNQINRMQVCFGILITPMGVFIFSLIIIFILGLLGFLVNFDRHIFGHRNSHMLLYALFNMDWEGNIPTAFSAMGIVFSALIFFLLSKTEKNDHGQWYVHYVCLGWMFAFLACDEILGFHEQISDIISRDLHIASSLVLGTVLFAIVIVPLGVVFCWRWLLVLPPRVTLVMILSAAIYLLGAVGMEVVGISYAKEVGGKNNLTYQMFAIIEETLEMIGIAIFNYALLTLLLWQKRQDMLRKVPYAITGAASGWVLTLLKPGEMGLLPAEEAVDGLDRDMTGRPGAHAAGLLR
jgi:hypothetical protein